jgi:hypothetical protein
MQRTIATAIALMSLWCVTASRAAGEELLANTWSKAEDDSAGGAVGAVVYVPDSKGMLLYGYPALIRSMGHGNPAAAPG